MYAAQKNIFAFVTQLKSYTSFGYGYQDLNCSIVPRRMLAHGQAGQFDYD